MKFTVEKESFYTCVNRAGRSVQQKSSISVLEGLLIKAEGQKVILTGYDLEIGITCETEASVKEEGVTVISAKLLTDICRIANGSVIDVTTNGTTVEITSGTVFYEISSMNANDFPQLPVPDAEPALKMDSATLKEMIDLTIYAISSDDTNPVNTGELFELTEDKLTIVALDGFRLAICTRPVVSNTSINIVVPGKTMSEVTKLITEGEIEISVSQRYIVFSCADFTLVSRLVNGVFLDYRRVIPSGEQSFVRVDAKELNRCVDRASLVISERIKNPLKILFDEQGIHLDCQTSLGRVNDDMECEFSGEPVQLGFNSRYLQDALKASNSEFLRFEIINALTAVKVYPDEGDAFMYLVLPVRFKATPPQGQENTATE